MRKPFPIDWSAHQEELHSATFDRSPVAISISRLADGLFANVNRQWCLLLGFSREEALGKSSLELGIWDSTESRQTAMQTAVSNQGDANRFAVVNYNRRDGQKLVLRWQGWVVPINGEDYLVTYTTNVTEQDAAQQILLESEKALQRLNDTLASQMELYVLTESLARVGHWTVDQNDTMPNWSAGMFDVCLLYTSDAADDM
jgi:PAS domain S-box-containing protein